MNAVVANLDNRLATWSAETAAEVEQMVEDIIAWANAEAPDLAHTRRLEQEVLDLIDGP